MIAIIAAVFAYKQYQNVKENEKLLKERHAQIEKVQRYNKEIEKKMSLYKKLVSMKQRNRQQTLRQIFQLVVMATIRGQYEAIKNLVPSNR